MRESSTSEGSVYKAKLCPAREDQLLEGLKQEACQASNLGSYRAEEILVLINVAV